MSIVSKISYFLKHDRDNISESENVQKILLLNFMIIIISIISLFFSISHFIFFEKPLSYILFSFFIIFISLFFIHKKTKNYKLVSNTTIILSTILFLILIIAGSGQKTGIIWGLTYPILVSLTFDLKKANYFSIAFLAITVFLFFIPSNIWAEYSIDLKIRYIGIYTGLFLYLQYYLKLKQQSVNNREKQIVDFQQKLREKDEFLSGLSYQIRTPLNNIAGIFNVKREALGKEIVEEVELSISNLITIVNSIPESFDKKLLQIKGEKASFNINSTIKKSANLFQTDKYSDLKCSLHLSSKVPQAVYGDRLLVIQIIISSIDFFYNNKENELLKIDLISTLNDNSSSVLLKIRSNFNNKFLKLYLNAESDIDFDKNKELLMIKELTNLLSGKFEVKFDESNTSFLFSFNFPEEKETEQIIKDDINISINEGFFENKNKNKKELKEATILLVEDDIMNSKVMTLNLQKRVKKIIIASNGKEALEKYASTRVDLILMDIRMPLMDGFKTTEKIRESELGTGFRTPIIAVTANASSEVKKKCIDVGMDDFTTKPTNFSLLITKMEGQLK